MSLSFTSLGLVIIQTKQTHLGLHSRIKAGGHLGREKLGCVLVTH